VLCGCETYSLALREANNLKVFGNLVLGGIFELKRQEIRGKADKTA
jgi:hypothetical protein